MSITELIKLTGLSDTKLAGKLGGSAISVMRWRTGRKVPTQAMRDRLCRLAGVRYDEVEWTRTHSAE